MKEELAARMTGDALFGANGRVVLPSPGMVAMALQQAEITGSALSRQPSLERAIAVRDAVRPIAEQRELALTVRASRKGCDVYVARPG